MPQLDLDWLNEELSNIANEGLRRERQTVCPLNHGRCQIDGQILNNFASNDYLDLAGDPRLISAAIEALESVGVGARASPLVCGRTEWHERLEERI
ncbi:MAG: 8-amino-7-oxononanoate synthase, partial [Planctomycetes bacterium]|nr:8-amino-7-oxononanoate synthase [Planctomycetota bacterium]